jgi:hypothetical protein
MIVPSALQSSPTHAAAQANPEPALQGFRERIVAQEPNTSIFRDFDRLKVAEYIVDAGDCAGLPGGMPRRSRRHRRTHVRAASIADSGWAHIAARYAELSAVNPTPG